MKCSTGAMLRRESVLSDLSPKEREGETQRQDRGPSTGFCTPGHWGKAEEAQRRNSSWCFQWKRLPICPWAPESARTINTQTHKTGVQMLQAISRLEISCRGCGNTKLKIVENTMSLTQSRHPGVWSQVGLRKHYYEQSWWRWRNFSWAISNPTGWCCSSAALNMSATLSWKTQQWPEDQKRSSLLPIPRKGSTQVCANHWTIALTSHTSRIMLKTLHARLQGYRELPDVQAAFRNGRGTANQIANIHWILEKARGFWKISTSASCFTDLY